MLKSLRKNVNTLLNIQNFKEINTYLIPFSIIFTVIPLIVNHLIDTNQKTNSDKNQKNKTQRFGLKTFHLKERKRIG